jgi:photosystem II stability/assembly factor-like uncharacterized protein
MVIDPIYTDTVYLATFNRGILKTPDGGYHWQEAGLQDDHIYSVAINPKDSSRLLAGTAGNGIHRSLYYANDWKVANNGIDNAMTTSILISPSDPDRLFTSIYGAGVFSSPNRGLFWGEMNTGLEDKFIHALVPDPDQPGVIYALSDTAGLYQNNLEDGKGWVRIGQGLPFSQQYQPAYAEDHPFASCEIHECSSEPEEALGNHPQTINLLSMIFAPSNPQIAYLGTGSGVYKSTNGGGSWLPAGLSGEIVQSLAIDPVTPSLVYAATSTPGSLKISVDGGNNWSDASLPVTFFTLATTMTKPGVLYTGTSSGLYIYETNTWTQLGLADQVITSVHIDPRQPDRIFAGTANNGAFYSTDGGNNWAVMDKQLLGHTIQAINLDPNFPNFIFFATKTHGIYLATKYP